jgi:hypothetical protein
MVLAGALVAALLGASGSDAPRLAPEPGWPRWLTTAEGTAADQTSGLAFVGRDGAGDRVFLVADDTGDLWRMTLQGRDETIRLYPIPFRGAAEETLARFAKRDLEGIAYCPATARLLLSIEGNVRPGAPAGAPFRDALGIFEATLDAEPLRASRVTRLTRLALPAWDGASRLAAKNRGFEGIAFRGDTLLLGLEGITTEGEGFADSTVFELFDLRAGTWSEHGTGRSGIETITGLDVSPEGVVYGVDRNQLRLFTARFGPRGASIRSAGLSMPGVRGVPYRLPSPESIAVDDAGFVWIAVDPWVYEPATLDGLMPRDVARYKKKVPMLYKFRDPFRSVGPASRPR